MDEYLKTLALRSAEGDTAAGAELDRTIAYIEKQNRALEAMTQRLAAEPGATVTHSDDGRTTTITFD